MHLFPVLLAACPRLHQSLREESLADDGILTHWDIGGLQKRAGIVFRLCTPRMRKFVLGRAARIRLVAVEPRGSC